MNKATRRACLKAIVPGLTTLLTILPAEAAMPTEAAKPEAAAQARIAEGYGELPLHFEANRGQTDNQVKFLSRGPGYSLFLTPSEAVLSLRKGESSKDDKSPETVVPSVGADPRVRPKGQGRHGGLPLPLGASGKGGTFKRSTPTSILPLPGGGGSGRLPTRHLRQDPPPHHRPRVKARSPASQQASIAAGIVLKAICKSPRSPSPPPPPKAPPSPAGAAPAAANRKLAR
jgi:hypothetical protein